MKIIKKILACAIITIIIVVVVRFLIVDTLGITYLQINEPTCCGLESGSLVLFTKFDPSALQRGEIILFNDYETGRRMFTHVTAFPGESLFQDLYTGRWGYAGKIEMEQGATLTEEEISNLFSQITWLNSPTFTPTVPSQNLYDRLILLNDPIYANDQKYRTANDINPEFPYTGAIAAEQIIGVYGLTLASADSIWLFYLAVFAVLSVLYWIFLVFLPRIFIKLIKNKRAQPPLSQA